MTWIEVEVISSHRKAWIDTREIEGIVMPDTVPDKPGEAPRSRVFTLMLKSGISVFCEPSRDLEKLVDRMKSGRIERLWKTIY